MHQVKLSNQKLLCWTTFTNSWIQNGKNIYYFKVTNIPADWTIKYELVRYNLIENEETVLKEFTTEMTFITKHNGDHDPNLTTSVIFSHYELNTVETNWNEHEEEEDEEKFLNQQFVTICQEYYSEPEGERFMLHMRQIGHFDTKIVEKVYKDRRDGIRVLFLQVKA